MERGAVGGGSAIALVLGLAALVGGAPVQAATTTLDFSGLGVGDGAPIPQSYGDNAANTPHVTVAYRDESGNGLYYWGTGYSDLFGVAWNRYSDIGAGLTDVWMEIELTAAPGYRIALHGFDLGNWLSGDQTIPSVDVLDGNGQILYSQSSVLVRGSGQPHTAFTFATPLSAETLRIHVDTTNDGAADSIGIDNIVFSETIAVPEPGLALFALLGCAAAALARSRRR